MQIAEYRRQILGCSLLITHPTSCNTDWTGYTVHCHNTLHTLHCTLHTAHCTLHTANCSRYFWMCLRTVWCICSTQAVVTVCTELNGPARYWPTFYWLTLYCWCSGILESLICYTAPGASSLSALWPSGIPGRTLISMTPWKQRSHLLLDPLSTLRPRKQVKTLCFFIM